GWFLQRTAPWNQKLSLHPHVHCVIPAGGLGLDHTRWVQSQNRFFLPLKVLSKVFRGKFVAGLKQAFQSGRLSFHGNLAPLARPKTFAAWLRLFFRKDWVVYAKTPLRWPGICASVSEPLHSSRGYLQSSTALVH